MSLNDIINSLRKE